MQKRNYQKEMEGVIASLSSDAAPGLLLHSCCAPCSSSVLETLAAHFSVTLFYYNPNIFPEEEYQKRVQEQKRLIAARPGRRENCKKSRCGKCFFFYKEVK